jgi:hypothetical protein
MRRRYNNHTTVRGNQRPGVCHLLATGRWTVLERMAKETLFSPDKTSSSPTLKQMTFTWSNMTSRSIARDAP